MQQRSFSYVLEASESIATGTADWSAGADTVTAQEDILIDSMEIEAQIEPYTTTLAVAGNERCEVRAELSTAGGPRLPGAMGECVAKHALTLQGAITPNAVQAGDRNNIFLQFDPPFQVKEEGTINLHLYRSNNVGVNVTMAGVAYIHYHKG